MLALALSAAITAYSKQPTRRPRLHCSRNRHNTTVWSDSRQGSRYNHITVYVSSYTETNTNGKLSPNNGRLSGANKVGFFSSRQSGQIPAAHAWDSSVVAMDKTYVIALVRDMTPLGDQRDTNYRSRELKPKIWDEIEEKLNVAGKY